MDATRRTLVVVSGGVAETFSDEDVEAIVIDLDSIEEGDRPYIPEGFDYLVIWAGLKHLLVSEDL